jgi:hypothetical protein
MVRGLPFKGRTFGACSSSLYSEAMHYRLFSMSHSTLGTDEVGQSID